MAETTGLLMIVFALSIGCWRFYKGRKLPATGLALVVLACFIGVALVLNKRVSELSFGKLATLKATVSQAQSDAEQIAGIHRDAEARSRIEFFVDFSVSRRLGGDSPVAGINCASQPGVKSWTLLDQTTCYRTFVSPFANC